MHAVEAHRQAVVAALGLFTVCWPSEVSEEVCLCVLEWGCVLKTRSLMQSTFQIKPMGFCLERTMASKSICRVTFLI